MLKIGLVGVGGISGAHIPVWDQMDDAELICLCDIRPERMENYKDTKHCYTDFDEMLANEKIDILDICLPTYLHADFAVKAMEKGINVITEKPMTTRDDLCRNILEAEKRTGRKVIVTFNYRYAPFMTKVKELIVSGAIGDVYSVHFEWLLTRNMELEGHGASYFRRWNARMEKSSGLLVHKSTHHFDLVNWWLGQRPAKVSSFAQLNLYGAKNSPYADVPSPGLRCSNCPHAKECQFFYKPTEFEDRFYIANEAYDGYMKDNCVYADDIDIYDTMAVTVQYDKGAVLSYSLNATAMYEGWHCVINGSKGRLEIHNYEQGIDKTPQNHIRLYDLNNNVTDYAISRAGGGHGGGDIRLRNMLFLDNIPDPLGHAAGTADGAYSILVGVAANKSIATGEIVSIEDLLK